MRSWGNETEKRKKQIQVVSEEIPAEGNQDSVSLGTSENVHEIWF